MHLRSGRNRKGCDVREEAYINAVWQYSASKYFYFIRTPSGNCGNAWRNEFALAIFYIGGPDDGKVSYRQ